MDARVAFGVRGRRLKSVPLTGCVGTASGAAKKRPGREVVMNQVALGGNVDCTLDELRYTQSGTKRLEVLLASRSMMSGTLKTWASSLDD
jgi:hypothetical protein